MEGEYSFPRLAKLSFDVRIHESVNDRIGLVDPFQTIPNELLLLIFSYLDPGQLLACGQVSRRWRLVASDWYLWQSKLIESDWRTIVCHQRPVTTLSFRDLSAVHPKEIYQFLIKFIPKFQLKKPASTMTTLPDYENTQDNLEDSYLDPTNENQTRFLVSSIFSSLWGHVRRILPFQHRSSVEGIQKPRFILFGPGFDHRDTNKLFRKMVDTRTKSFEPIDMFTGHMGFGSGITLRLSAQAQRAALDSSICLAHECLLSDKQTDLAPAKRSPYSCISRPNTPPSCVSGSFTENIGNQRAMSLPTRTPHAFDFQSFRVLDSDSPCNCRKLDDFTFDLSYVYSLPAHLNHIFSDEYSRLCVSRLFRRSSSSHEPLPESEFLSSLTVTYEMTQLCRTIDGLVYAIDAREPLDQLSHLYFELSAVLRGFPPSISSSIPIVVLYIMPKEAIKLPPVAKNMIHARTRPYLVNRDSYSGAEYTAAWRDSPLLPLSALRLFELPNPWRLQKCSSNDIKTLIQCIMWLHVKQEYRKQSTVTPAVLRSASTTPLSY